MRVLIWIAAVLSVLVRLFFERCRYNLGIIRLRNGKKTVALVLIGLSYCAVIAANAYGAA